ncbi:ArnT family glycosyltransferase [Chloroflexota bacterium]
MPETEEHAGGTSKLKRAGPWLVLAGLVLFHAANNWRWLVENVTSTGWDKPRHLARSLNYAGMLWPVSLRSLFGMMVSDPVRPPLFPASAAIMYWLFGETADVATMVNILYLAIALAATYGIGRRWAGQRIGLLSAVLLAFFPMFYSMSRYFYLEFAVTAMVALTVYLLLATDGFQRRSMSLWFGLCLGLGLLTKRTFAVFVVGPVIVTVLASGLLPTAWQRVKQSPCFHWKSLLLALVCGLALSALWYLPNREAVQGLVLGDALFVLWWALAAAAVYFVLLPSAPLSNALSAFFLAAGLASTWYLARIEFLERVALYGYGIDDPRGRALRLDELDSYLYYLRKLGNEHLAFVLFALLALVLVVSTAFFFQRHGTIKRALSAIRVEGWAIVAWFGGAYALLTLSIYQETRALTPALPAVALVFAAAVLKLPWKRLRLGLVALILAFGLLQFVALTYEPVQKLVPPQTLKLPLWGRTASMAQGVYIQLPDEDKTDRGYWIIPDILDRMQEHRLRLGKAQVSAGLLVNTSQINAGPFNYLILTEYPQLRVESLISRYDESSPYARLFAHEFALVKRVNSGMNPSQKEVIEAILEGPPPLFEQAFELDARYPLPDGDTVYLYRQRYRLPADYPHEYVTALAESLSSRTRDGDAILLTPPSLLGTFAAAYTGPALLSLVPEGEAQLAELASQHPRVFLVLGDADTGQVEGWVQEWLDVNAFRSGGEWSGSVQMLTYGTTPGTPAMAPTVPIGADLGGHVELIGADWPAATWHPQEVIPVTLFWQPRTTIGEDYAVFVHLVDSGGGVIAQTDSGPVGGMEPTSGWKEGNEIVDRHGILIPHGLPPGEYGLLAGMYLPSSGVRLPLLGHEGQVLGDSVELGRVSIAPR